MSEEAKWYVVHTYSGYENKVAGNLEKIIENRKLQHLFFDIKIPVEKVIKVVKKKSKKKAEGEEAEDEMTAVNNEQNAVEETKEVEHKLYPSYVLIKMIMNDESWHVVRNIRGCTGFVGPDSKPVELTDEEVANMGVEIKSVELDFAVGDMVKINAVPFAGYTGKVEEITPDKKKVKVIISLFGRDTPVELDASSVTAEKL